MRPLPAIYCPTCLVMQGIRDWRERHESLLIQLEPCGHVIVRSARVEWAAHGAAVA